MTTEAPRTGALTGQEIDLGGQTVTLGVVLGRHADTSATYLSAGQQSFVVRVYPESYRPSDELQLKSMPPTINGVWAYTYVGQARIKKTTVAGPSKSRTVWTAVRTFGLSSLKDFITPSYSGNTTTVDSFRLATDVARGLKGLHSHGVYHGDIRPSNIMFGTGDNAELVDYGLAVDGVHGIKAAELLYASPEALIEGRRNSPASDVYSFGKLIKMISALREPGDAQKRDLISHIAVECLRTDPMSRPSMAQVWEWLESADSGEPVTLPIRELSVAIVADLDSRLPVDVVAHHSRKIRRLVDSTAVELTAALRSATSIRLANLRIFDMVHFAASVVLVRSDAVQLRAPLMRFGLLKAMQFGALESSGQESADDLSGTQLDATWRDEIESAALDDLAGTGVSEGDKQAYVSKQLAYAADLRREILMSDVFIRSEDVAVVMSERCPGITSDEVRILRELGYLVSLEVDGLRVYPLFQFDPTSGLPYSVIKHWADQLGYVSPSASSWSSAIWWFLGHPVLDELSPAEWIRTGKPLGAVIHALANRLRAA